MQLVIRVDLDKAKQSLPEIFRLIGDRRWVDEANAEAATGAAGVIKDSRSHAIGEWNIEEAENPPHPLESSYRAAATARYFRSRQIEVDRFATVSLTDDGAYVQGWLYVPQSDVESSGQEPSFSRKPPRSVFPIRSAEATAG